VNQKRFSASAFSGLKSRYFLPAYDANISTVMHQVMTVQLFKSPVMASFWAIYTKHKLGQYKSEVVTGKLATMYRIQSETPMRINFTKEDELDGNYALLGSQCAEAAEALLPKVVPLATEAIEAIGKTFGGAVVSKTGFSWDEYLSLAAKSKGLPTVILPTGAELPELTEAQANELERIKAEKEGPNA
jgi:hypothetical protein